MTIARARFELALEQLGPDDGFAFERFANAFLATEMPDLRPVAGIHDGGRDAFIYSSTGLAEAFIQHSTTSDWRGKTRSTVRDLRKAGHQVRHLTYTTPRAIASKVDSLRIELREDGVLLDVRDREYFLTHVTTVPARQQLAESLAQHYVDPLLSRRGVLRDATLALTDEEERVAATYLQLDIGAKDPAKAVTKSVFEALVLYSLREATPDALVGRPDLQKAVARFTPASEQARVHALLDGTLKRLVSRDVVKHHEREDAFTLGYEHRVAMGHRIEQFLAARASVLSEAEDRVDRVAAALGVDYEYDPTAVASDALDVTDKILCANGRLAALALVRSGDFFAKRASTIAAAEQTVRDSPDQLRSLKKLEVARFMDLVPAVADDLLARPSDAIAVRLRSASDAYCLLFALKETADVQGAIDKVFRGGRLQVDTSILIPSMAEQLLPLASRRMTNLLRAAAASGFRLLVGEDVLNELQTHLERLVLTYRRHTTAAVSAVGGPAAAVYQSLLIASYLTAGSLGSFEEFVERFMGNQDPRRDLVDFLKHELRVEFDEMAAARSSIPATEVETVVEQWRLVRRRRPTMDEDAFETLVRHDAKTFLLVESLRRNEEPASGYGHTWWWLTMDGSAYRIDRLRRGGRTTSLCMSPEFFARYLSVTPKTNQAALAASELLPISIEIAGLGLVPADLRAEAGRLYEGTKQLPEYLRRRKLRELVNRAYATRGDAAETETESDEG